MEYILTATKRERGKITTEAATGRSVHEWSLGVSERQSKCVSERLKCAAIE